MKTVYLKDFIKTGKFGGIEVGVSTKDDVVSLMGNDYDFGDFGETQIIKYGWYEFFYWTKNGVVHAIQNDHLPACGRKEEHRELICYENDMVNIDTWFLEAGRNIKFSEVVNILSKEGIEYGFKKYNFEDALEFIKLKNGIIIDFDNNETIYNYDKTTDEWSTADVLIENQDNYILNGIRLYDY